MPGARTAGRGALAAFEVGSVLFLGLTVLPTDAGELRSVADAARQRKSVSGIPTASSPIVRPTTTDRRFSWRATVAKASGRRLNKKTKDKIATAATPRRSGTRRSYAPGDDTGGGGGEEEPVPVAPVAVGVGDSAVSSSEKRSGTGPVTTHAMIPPTDAEMAALRISPRERARSTRRPRPGRDTMILLWVVRFAISIGRAVASPLEVGKGISTTTRSPSRSHPLRSSPRISTGIGGPSSGCR